jgi:hypothetical protein
MGVPEGLPEEVHVGRFLEARIKEIAGKILSKILYSMRGPNIYKDTKP